MQDLVDMKKKKRAKNLMKKEFMDGYIKMISSTVTHTYGNFVLLNSESHRFTHHRITAEPVI